MRATVLLVLSALSCTHDKRVPSAEDVSHSRWHLMRTNSDARSTREDNVTVIWNRVWCWLRRHPHRYISFWCVKATRARGSVNDVGPCSPTDVQPYVAIEWSCPLCGDIRFMQITH